MIVPLLNLLLVEPDSADAAAIRAMLADVPRPAFHIDAVTSCADALVRLGRGGVDVVLLDLMLPDGRGLMVFEQIRRAAPEALILVLSASADEDCA